MEEGADERLSIRLFGVFEMQYGTAIICPLPSGRAQRLLALLLLQPGREIPRVLLAEKLWPESDEWQARNNLRQTLFELRNALGVHAHRISSTRQTMTLDLQGTNVDLLAFDHMIARDDPDSLQQAIALYRGPLLEGWSDAWVLLEREIRHQKYIEAHETLASRAIEDGAEDAALRHLEKAAAADLYHQSIHRMLMQLLARRKSYGAAIQVYHTLLQRLHSEYHDRPEPETTRLFTEIYEKTKRQSSLPPPLARPGVQGSLTGSIPQPLTDLIGRREEVLRVMARLLAARMVTLTGTGGIGKTRLAIQLALESWDDYADGVCYVELESVVDPNLVPQTVGRVMGIPAAHGRSWDEVVIAFLRDRQVLLVLDNCEHLLDACAQMARRVLRACPGIRILATSRRKLGLVGEVVLRVPPLGLPAMVGSADPDVLARSPAVRLFLERAMAARNDFTLMPENVVVSQKAGVMLVPLRG